jgi:Icc-related predicted phosphoesterase
MKICAISDIHGHLPRLQKCDVVCICGDIVPLYVQSNKFASIAWLAGPFQEWALKLPCKYVVITWGNHDFIGEQLMQYGSGRPNEIFTCNLGFDGGYQHSLLFQNDINHKIRILCHGTQEIDGVKFFGTPFCPALKNWAFYGDRDTLIERFNEIPEDTQVLLTHCPPRYMGQGLVHDTNFNYMKDFGCVELQEVLEEKFAMRDMWVISGHIHTGKHDIEKYNNIKYRNCSIKDEDYEVKYIPFIFDV